MELMDLLGRMADGAYRSAALAAAHDEPVRPINELVDDLRADERGWVPYVAPTWGGVHAEVLFLYRDPGPMTHPDNAGSGLLSAENDDDTARRLAWLLDSVRIPQHRGVSWNAYPWYINRPPRSAELEAGVAPLRRLISLLPDLRVVVLCGGHARNSWNRLARRYPTVAERYVAIETYHTSNQMLLWMSSSDLQGSGERDLGSSEVSEDGSGDLSCDVGLEAADGLFAGLAFGESAGHVGLGGLVPAES
jgi:hypothetical protein